MTYRSQGLKELFAEAGSPAHVSLNPTRTEPIPKEIPDGTSPYIAESIRRRRMLAEQERVLRQVEAELGIDVKLERQLRALEERDYSRSVRRRRGRLATEERFSREDVIERDDSTCYLCGKRCHSDEIHIDHKTPISRGGKHALANVAVACSSCNLRKGALTTSEYLATLVSSV